MYISVHQLRVQLPDQGGDLTDIEINTHIEFWKSELARVNSKDQVPEPTTLTRRIVRDGAYADALEDILERDGIFDHPGVEARRGRAEKNLEHYDALSISDPDEVAAENYPVVISEAPFYASSGLPEEYEG